MHGCLIRTHVSFTVWLLIDYLCCSIDNQDGVDSDEIECSTTGNPQAKKLYSAIRSKRQASNQKTIPRQDSNGLDHM